MDAKFARKCPNLTFLLLVNVKDLHVGMYYFTVTIDCSCQNLNIKYMFL